MSSGLRHVLQLSKEVRQALVKAPTNILASKLVLLESAILTHGMPRPQNWQMVKEVQDIIRSQVEICH